MSDIHGRYIQLDEHRRVFLAKSKSHQYMIEFSNKANHEAVPTCDSQEEDGKVFTVIFLSEEALSALVDLAAARQELPENDIKASK